MPGSKNIDILNLTRYSTCVFKLAELLTSVAAEHSLVQSHAAGKDRWMVLRVDTSIVNHLLDDLDEALVGGHVQRRLHPLIEDVALAGVNVW